MGILQVTHLLNNLEFIIIPFVNPDGYVVSKSLKEEGGREGEIHPFVFPCSLHGLTIVYGERTVIW